MLAINTFATSLVTLALAFQSAPHLQLRGIILASGSPVEKTLENSRLGCRTADALAEAAKQQSSDKFLMEKLKAGDCKLVPAGNMQIEATSLPGESPAQSCVRPKGSGECWWVLDEFLK